jgi:hypothetical protein
LLLLLLGAASLVSTSIAVADALPRSRHVHRRHVPSADVDASMPREPAWSGCHATLVTRSWWPRKTSVEDKFAVDHT